MANGRLLSFEIEMTAQDFAVLAQALATYVHLDGLQKSTTSHASGKGHARWSQCQISGLRCGAHLSAVVNGLLDESVAPAESSFRPATLSFGSGIR